MMASDGLAPGLVYRRVDPIAGLQFVRPNLDALPDRLALRLHIDDARLCPVPAEPAAVGGLSAALGIEGGLLEEHVRELSFAGNREDVGHGGVSLQTVVANEPARPSRQRCGETAGGGPAPVPLGLHP